MVLLVDVFIGFAAIVCTMLVSLRLVRPRFGVGTLLHIVTTTAVACALIAHERSPLFLIESIHGQGFYYPITFYPPHVAIPIVIGVGSIFYMALDGIVLFVKAALRRDVLEISRTRHQPDGDQT